MKVYMDYREYAQLLEARGRLLNFGNDQSRWLEWLLARYPTLDQYGENEVILARALPTPPAETEKKS